MINKKFISRCIVALVVMIALTTSVQALSINKAIESNNEVIEIDTVEKFIDTIENDVYANIRLTEDLNFLKISSGSVVFDFTFYGTIDGNGYGIKNLNATLFNTIEDATISNVLFDYVEISNSSSRGILASNSITSSISNVVIMNSKFTSSNSSSTGGLVGRATNTTVDQVTMFNVTINGSQVVGSLVGETLENTIISNVLIEDVVLTGGYDSGGVIGRNGSNSNLKVQNCVFRLTYNGVSGTTNRGGIIGRDISYMEMENTFIAVDTTGTVLKHIIGTGGIEVLINNYQWTDSNMTSQLIANKIYGFSSEEVTSSLFETIELQSDIWDYSDVSIDAMPYIKTNNEYINAYQTRLPNAPDALKTIEEYDVIIKSFGIKNSFTQE